MATAPHAPPASPPTRPITPSDQSAAGTPTTPPARRPWPDARVQGAWYERNRDHPVRLRLMDGSELDGVLVAADTYTLALRPPGRAEPILVNKHAIAVLARLEDEATTRGPAGAPAPPS